MTTAQGRAYTEDTTMTVQQANTIILIISTEAQIAKLAAKNGNAPQYLYDQLEDLRNHLRQSCEDSK